MEKPKAPLNRAIYEGDQPRGKHICPYCGSSMKKKWIFFRDNGCIQTECINHYEKRKHNSTDDPDWRDWMGGTT